VNVNLEFEKMLCSFTELHSRLFSNVAYYSEVPNSNLGLETGSADRVCSQWHSIYPGKRPHSKLN
jgi:hypothetical protein